MSTQNQMVTLRLDEALRDSKRQATSMSLPLAVHHRLDVIAQHAAAVNASRAELIGMFIAEAALDADRLEQGILAYRKMAVGDVVPEPPQESAEPAGDNVVSIAVRTAGRPAKHATG